MEDEPRSFELDAAILVSRQMLLAVHLVVDAPLLLVHEAVDVDVAGRRVVLD